MGSALFAETTRSLISNRLTTQDADARACFYSSLKDKWIGHSASDRSVSKCREMCDLFAEEIPDDTIEPVGLCSLACNYCANGTAMNAYVVNGFNLRPSTFKLFAEAGFRRSGNMIYKICSESGCCRCFPIAIAPQRFSPEPSHEKVLRRFARWVGGNDAREKGGRRSEGVDHSALRTALEQEGVFDRIRGWIEKALDDCGFAGYLSPEKIDVRFNVAKRAMESNFLLKKRRSGPMAADIENALRRILPSSEDDLVQSFSVANGMAYLTVPEALTEPFLRRFSLPAANRPADPVCRPKSVEVEIAPLAFSQEHFDLFERYERAVHKKETSAEKFRSFLCASPIRRSRDSRAPACTGHHYGSFTRALRVDGRVVYVGFPPFPIEKAFWTFSRGRSTPSTSSTSRRCAFWRPGSSRRCTKSRWPKASRSRRCIVSPRLTFQALGLYIHDCRKMRYKEQFKPAVALKTRFSEETGGLAMEWVELEQLQRELDLELQTSLESRLAREVVFAKAVTTRKFLEFVRITNSAEGYLAVRGELWAMSESGLQMLLMDEGNWRTVSAPLFYLYLIMGRDIFNTAFIVLTRPEQ